MRKAILVVGGVLGAIVIVVIALGVYAVMNLGAIVQANRGLILTRASDALGRKFDVAQISASLGWGAMVDLRSVTIADDPSFSKEPFLTASDIYVRVAFIPLLFKQVEITKLSVSQPDLQIIRNREGVLNVSSLGKKTGAAPAPAGSQQPQPPAAEGTSKKPEKAGQQAPGSPMLEAKGAQPAKKAGAIAMLSVRSLAVDEGTIRYRDLASSQPPIAVRSINLAVENFSVNSPFSVALSMAALGTEPNLKVEATVGPLAHAGKIDYAAFPITGTITVGPVSMAALSALPTLKAKVPKALVAEGPLGAIATIAGTPQHLTLGLKADLTSNHLGYQGVFDKPAGTQLTLSAKAQRQNNVVQLNTADLALAGLKLGVADVKPQSGAISARLDTNRFDLAPLAALVTALAKYQTSGSAELHGTVSASKDNPAFNGTFALHQVSLTLPGAKVAAVSGLDGSFRMTGTAGELGPLNFKLGTSPAHLLVKLSSLKPLAAAYQFGATDLKPGEFTKSLGASDEIKQLSLSGDASGALSDPRITLNSQSSSGSLKNAAYSSFALKAQWNKPRLDIASLGLNAFTGTLSANGNAEASKPPAFNLTLGLNHIDLQQVLVSQHAKAADMVRGLATGNVQVAGRGANFQAMKPTLNGKGALKVANGKLLGVNVVAQALGKVQGLPGIGALLPAGVIANHPELFKNPNTDIDSASLTFTLGQAAQGAASDVGAKDRLKFALGGPRLTTHDLKVLAPDYQLNGDGWFDLDQNIDMQAQIMLSAALSKEIVAQKKSVAYLTDSGGRVIVPLRIWGTLPKPTVAPDVALLAKRAASRAIESKGQKFMGKMLGKTPLGGLLGGSTGGPSGTGTTPPAPSGASPTSNPLGTLKKMF